MRDAVLRMRVDEACIHHLNSVLADLNPGDKCVRACFATVQDCSHVAAVAFLRGTHLASASTHPAATACMPCRNPFIVIERKTK